MKPARAKRKPDADTVDVIRSECGESFWRELRNHLWRYDAKKAVLMRTSRAIYLDRALYEMILPKVRGRLVGTRPKAPPAVSRTIVLRMPTVAGALVDMPRQGWSLDLNSILVAARRDTSFREADAWLMAHVETGRVLTAFSAPIYTLAASYVARCEAACPSVTAFDPDTPETLAAFNAELAAWQALRRAQDEEQG